MACSEVAAFLQTGEARIFSSHSSYRLVFAALLLVFLQVSVNLVFTFYRQIANNLLPIAKNFNFFLCLTHNIIRKNV